MDLTETIKVTISVIAIITIPPLALATTIIPAIKELIPSYNSHKNYATGTHK